MSEQLILPVQEEEEEDKPTNVISIADWKAAAPAGPTYGNWLQNLELGSVFLIRDKNNIQNFALGLFQLIHKTNRSVRVLTYADPNVPPQDNWVDPNRFCMKFDLQEVLSVVELQGKEQQETQEVIEDGVSREPTD